MYDKSLELGARIYTKRLDLRASSFPTLSSGIGLAWIRITILLLLDSLTLTLGWWLSIRWGTPAGSFALLWTSSKQPGFLLPILVISIGIFAASGLYGTDDRRRDFFTILKSLSIAEIILSIITYFYNSKIVLEGSIIWLSWGLCLILILIGRGVLQSIVLQVRSRGIMRKPIALLGNSEEIGRAAEFLKKTKQYDIKYLGNISSIESDRLDFSETSERIRNQKIKEVFICSPLSDTDKILLYWELKAAGIHWRIFPMGIELPIQRSEIKMVNGIPTMRFRYPALVGSDFWLKRGFDLLAASLILVLTSPVFLLIAILIKLDSPGPVFYKQTRIGLKGRHFLVWKFRTMVVDAENRLQQLEAKNEMKGGILFKMKDDPRITKVGKFLRRYSLDELPQIFNVILGEMSLVGPRPFQLRDVARFSEHHYLRQEVLPGITGLWQVSGRSDMGDFEDVFRLDMIYIQNWSIALDFQILFQTIPVVLKREGAY